MSVTSNRNIQISFSGDITSDVIQSALENDASPGKIDVVTLAIGNNTIITPSVVGLVPTALTIILPAGNLIVITLKGVAGDTGIALHVTDPTSLALDTTFTSLILNVATAVVGVRLIWS